MQNLPIISLEPESKPKSKSPEVVGGGSFGIIMLEAGGKTVRKMQYMKDFGCYNEFYTQKLAWDVFIGWRLSNDAFFTHRTRILKPSDLQEDEHSGICSFRMNRIFGLEKFSIIRPYFMKNDLVMHWKDNEAVLGWQELRIVLETFPKSKQVEAKSWMTNVEQLLYDMGTGLALLHYVAHQTAFDVELLLGRPAVDSPFFTLFFIDFGWSEGFFTDHLSKTTTKRALAAAMNGVREPIYMGDERVLGKREPYFPVSTQAHYHWFAEGYVDTAEKAANMGNYAKDVLNLRETLLIEDGEDLPNLPFTPIPQSKKGLTKMLKDIFFPN